MVRDPRTSFKLFTQVLDVGKKFELSQNSIEGCILKPKTGSSSVPVTNLSTCPRVTLPLLPPAMNIHSVVDSIKKIMLRTHLRSDKFVKTVLIHCLIYGKHQNRAKMVHVVACRRYIQHASGPLEELSFW